MPVVSMRRLRTRERNRHGRQKRVRVVLKWRKPFNDQTLLSDRTHWRSRCRDYLILLSEIRSDMPSKIPYLDSDGNIRVKRNPNLYPPLYYAISIVEGQQVIIDRCSTYGKAVEACEFDAGKG